LCAWERQNARLSNDHHVIHDVAIIGGGPAGLSAAIWLGRYLHSVVLVDSGDPRNWETRGVNGFLGLPGVRPAALREEGRDQAQRHGVALVEGCVARVSREATEEFLLRLEDKSEYRARRVLLAFGIRDVWPDVPGLSKVYGETAHVCPDCDGYEARGKRTVVIGAGRRAVGMALNLTTWTPHIVICTNGQPAGLGPDETKKVAALNIPVVETKVKKLSPGSTCNVLELEDGMPLDCEQIFFTIGQYPADDLGKQLGCERDEHGQIIVDDTQHTSVKNVYAAGDIIPGPQLAVRAAATGAVAALAIHRSLVPAERML